MKQLGMLVATQHKQNDKQLYRCQCDATKCRNILDFFPEYSPERPEADLLSKVFIRPYDDYAAIFDNYTTSTK